MRDELMPILYNNSGKVLSTRWNENYFKKNYLEKYNNVLHKTSFLDVYDVSFSTRLTYIVKGFNSPVLCRVCGNHSGFRRDEYGKEKPYCSDLCRRNDPTLSEQIVERAKKRDNVLANNRRKKTMIEKYGYETNSQRPEIKNIISHKTISRVHSEETEERLSDELWLVEQYVKNGRPSTDIAKELGVYYGTVIDRLRKNGIDIRGNGNQSFEERQLISFIESLGVECIVGSRNIIPPYEIDIYIPEYNLAIEYNGLFWHSVSPENNISREYHLNKTKMCEDVGIQLMHINSYSWINQRDIVKSIIASKIGKNERIYARNTELREIPHKDQFQFFNDNHIQGGISASISYGLYYEGVLVFCMSFGKSRFDKNRQWELLRLSNKVGVNVVGGASKCLKFFVDTHGKSLMTYCDRSMSIGNVYRKLGFEFVRNTSVGYSWTDNERLYSRTKFMKHKLKSLLKFYDENLTEDENMFNNRYRKYYNCGNSVWYLSDR